MNRSAWKTWSWRLLVGLGIGLTLNGAGRAEADGEHETSAARSLTVDEAVAIALERHPALRVGRAEVDAAEYRVRQRIADYLPGGGYTYRLTHQQRSISAALGGAQQRRTLTSTFDYHATHVSLRQLLFDFGRTLDRIRAASAAAQASRFDLDARRAEVAFNAKRAFYGLLSAQRLLHVADETHARFQKHLDRAAARVEIGLAPRFDVTQSQVQLANAELDRLTAANNVALARETLRAALGLDEPPAYAPLDGPESDLPTVDAAAVVETAYTTRPELRSAAAQRQAAAYRVAALTKRYLPSVSGDARYDWTGRAHPLQQGWVLGVTLSVPLFDGIRTHAEVGEARADLRRREAALEELRRQVALEVRRGVLDLRRTAEQLHASRAVETQAAENLELAEGRYAAGVGTVLELVDAQVSLTSARAGTVQARYAMKTAQADLERAIGARLD